MQVNLSWPAVSGALYYKVYRSPIQGGPYNLTGLSNPPAGQPTTTYQDGPGNLINGQSYYYVVSTVTADGESSYSSEFAANAPAQPAAPSSLTGTVI